MLIPWQQLSADTLYAMLESFVLREGTDYGEAELSLDDKVTRLKQQLIDKQAVIVFSIEHQSANVMSLDEYHQLSEKDA